MNKAQVIGNLGSDPEVRHTQNGTTVARFSVATTERWTDQEGKKREHTEWRRHEARLAASPTVPARFSKRCL